MRSLDPMRNFPELDGLPDDQAIVLAKDVQKRITREPKILIGLIVTLTIAAILIFSLLSPKGILAAAFAGALVGAVAVGYMVLVIKPRMRAAFREMGYPRQT